MKRLIKQLKFMFHYCKEYKLTGAFILTTLIAATYFQVRAPQYIGDAIQALTEYVIASMQNNVTRADFSAILMNLIFFYVFASAANFLFNILFTVVVGKAVNNMRIGLFSKIEKMTLSFFERHKDGDILSRFTSDLENIQNSANDTLMYNIMNLSLLVGVLIMMFRQHVMMSLATIILTPITLLLAGIVMQKGKKYVDLQQKQLGDLNGYINEKISGQKVIIANHLQSETVAGFTMHNNQVEKYALKGQIYSGLLLPLMEGLALVNLALVIFYGSWLAFNGEIERATALGLIDRYRA